MSFGFSIGDFVAILQLAKDVRRRFIDAPEQFKAISLDVKNLTTVLNDVDDIVSERDLSAEQKARIENIAQGCYTILQELKVALDKYQELESRTQATGVNSRRVWKRFKWDQKDIDRFRNRIGLTINAFDTALGLINLKVSLEMNAGITRLHEREDDQDRRGERQAILNWLTPVDYAPQQYDFLRRREEGTGQWFLNSTQFKDWLDQSNQTLFCPGIPGAGKTILAAVVIDHLHTEFQTDASVGIAYLYCNFRRQYEQEPIDLLASLLKQFCYKLPSVPESLKSLYERHKNRSRPSLSEISQVLQSVITVLSKTFIIVDALDECQVSDRSCKGFLAEFTKIQATTGASLLTTSRSIPSIERMFGGSLLLEIRAHDTDVRKYLQNQLQERQLPSLILSDPLLQEEIITGIIRAVDGMSVLLRTILEPSVLTLVRFLLAELHLRSLTGKMTRKAIRIALGRLMVGSEAYSFAYKEAMERIEVGNASEFAKQVLSWITCAKRPLTALELQHALAVEVGEPGFDEQNIPDIEDMVSVCAGLVTVDKESGIIRLVHYTTQEYFEQTQISWFPNAENDIAMTCVTYLSLEIFEPGFCMTDGELKTRLQLNPLYDYAARNWGFHARTGVVVEPLILSFLENEAKVCAANQAMITMMASGPGLWRIEFSQYAPKRMTGLHLAAYFGLIAVSIRLIERSVSPDSKDEKGRTPLSFAAEKGHEGMVKLLLGMKNIDSDSESNYGQTPLSFAARNGHEGIVKLLLAMEEVDPNHKNHYDQTPLLLAAREGYEGIVKLLLDTTDIDLNSKDECDQTPLSFAVENEHEGVVELLLGMKDVDLNSKNEDGLTPLSVAAGHGHEGIVKRLLSMKGVNLNEAGKSPLSFAARYGHERIVELLLGTKDVDPNFKDENGQTPLSAAARNGQEGVVKLLSDRTEVDLNSKDRYGQTPLSLAAEHGHKRIVELLLGVKNVDPDSKSNYGQTPLSFAARNGHEGVVKLLLDRAEVDLNSKDVYGLTPLSITVKKGHERIFKLLLGMKDIDLNSKSNYGQTPLSLAARYGHIDILELLLSTKDVDPDSKSKYGQTPLSFAAKYGHESVVKLLLSTKDVDSDSKSKFGQTPLSFAAENGYEGIVKLLLATKEVDPNYKNEYGQTPLSLAAEYGHKSAVKLLLGTSKVDPDSKSNYGQTPMLSAAENGYKGIVKPLLDTKDIVLNSKDVYDQTPLSFAAQSEHEKL